MTRQVMIMRINVAMSCDHLPPVATPFSNAWGRLSLGMIRVSSIPTTC